MTNQPPVPRPAVADADLVRPDWIAGQPRKPDLLWLDKNENLDPELGAFVHRTIAEIRPGVAAVYPDVGPLYRKLATHLGCGPENLMLTAGSDAAIAAVFQAFVGPGDVVVHTSPSFAMYEVYGRIFGAERHPLEYARSPRGPVLDVEAAIVIIRTRKPRLVCLPNPDSPTGTVVAQPALQRLIQAAGEAGAVMVVDEAYYPFHTETALDWIGDHPNLVVIRSASKCWGLAGLRVGYMAACPALTEILHKVKPMYEIGSFAAAVFDRLLEHTEEMHAAVARLLEGKRVFSEAMWGMGFDVLDTAGNFLHVAFGDRAERVHRALAEVVFYRADFGHPSLRGYSRFSATTASGFAPVIHRIRSVA